MGRAKSWGAVTGAIALAALQLALASYAVASPLSMRPQIAITFDDAPLAVTPLLDTLEQKGAVATFFLVGQDAEANPSQAQAIASAGMLIGSHSYDHAHLATATAEQIRANLTLAQSAIKEQTGVTPRWYRSPYLDQNPLYDVVLPELGLTASWPTINPKDWSGPTPQQIIDLVLAQAAPGGIVILHDMDNRTNTIEALPGLIDGLRAAGYDLVTLDDIGRGAIEGTVSLSTSPNTSGAVVTAYDAAGTPIATGSVEQDGSYRLARLAPGSYKVGVAAADHVPGYYGGTGGLASAQSITVEADHTTAEVDVTLEGLPEVRLRAPSIVRYGGLAMLSVKLTDVFGNRLSGRWVAFDQSTDGVNWGPLGMVLTDSSGSAAVMSPSLYWRRYYRARLVEEDPDVEFASLAIGVKPKTYVSNPIAPSKISRRRYYTVYGYLKPRHSAGGYPVRIYKWRQTASGRWKSYGYVYGKARDYTASGRTYTKYARAIRLPYAGRWRLRAYTPADSLHAATWSGGYDYVRVK